MFIEALKLVAEPYFSVESFATAVLLALCWYIHSHYYRSVLKRLPPSPFQLPVVGCLPFLNHRFPHLTFSKWADQLGKIYSCRMGSQLIIVLNEANVIREAFAQAVFNGRPDMYTTRRTSQGYGISFAPDNTWQIHRQFALKTFKMLGMGKSTMENHIAEEAHRLVNVMATFKGKSFCNKNPLRTAVGNVICEVLFGQNFDTGNISVGSFFDSMNAVFRFFGVAGILNIFPSLIYVPKIRASFVKVVDALADAGKYIGNMFDEHLASFDGNAIRDYTDAFIASRLREKELYGKPQLFTDQQFTAAARELFLSGYDSTTATLRWAFLYTCANPAVQSKVHAELDHVVGRSRFPVCSDVNKLPYVQAVLAEVQRISCIGPMGVPHRAIEETELCGYTIPKDAWIFTNLWHVHRDSKVWENSDSFLPERFLSEDGQTVILPKDFMPFSAGKRKCPAESLAKREIFLLFATIMHQFSLKVDGPIDLEAVNGITLDTKDYLMTADLR